MGAGLLGQLLMGKLLRRHYHATAVGERKRFFMGSSYLSHEICQRMITSFLKFRSTGEKEAYSSPDDPLLGAKSFLFISEEG